MWMSRSGGELEVATPSQGVCAGFFYELIVDEIDII